MKILSYNSGSGGGIAAVDASSGSLIFSYEAEKDSFPKNSSATMESFMEGSIWFRELPDILARTGTARTQFEYNSATGTGYFGIGERSEEVKEATFFGQPIKTFSSTRERAHLWAAYSMSPFPQGEPCYVLVLDDALGDFYEVGGDLTVIHKGRAVDNPCHRLALVFALAKRGRADCFPLRNDDLGKMVGAASFGVASEADEESIAVIRSVLESSRLDELETLVLKEMDISSQRFRNFAAALSEAILTRICDYAEANLNKNYPLVVGGEGALNSAWATGLLNSNLFTHTFISPAANDAGCMIGTAADAMRHFTGRAKLEWSMYSGRPFLDDASTVAGLNGGQEVDLETVVDALASGKVLGWARGNCEIGKRALGNRSILASPFDETARTRINRIKSRNPECPISPVCREEDVGDYFECPNPSPYMLYLKRVIDPRLDAIKHVDGTARLQTVSRSQNAMLYDLLTAFKKRTGIGVLYNTSLNFKGAGFINRTSDLYYFAQKNKLDGFLAGIHLYWT